MLKFYIKSTEL